MNESAHTLMLESDMDFFFSAKRALIFLNLYGGNSNIKNKSKD